MLCFLYLSECSNFVLVWFFYSIYLCYYTIYVNTVNTFFVICFFIHFIFFFHLFFFHLFLWTIYTLLLLDGHFSAAYRIWFVLYHELTSSEICIYYKARDATLLFSSERTWRNHNRLCLLYLFSLKLNILSKSGSLESS